MLVRPGVATCHHGDGCDRDGGDRRYREQEIATAPPQPARTVHTPSADRTTPAIATTTAA